jgi:hypothetical protein
MADVKTESFQKKIREVLARGFETAGIRATVRLEKIPNTRLTRILVTSPTFKQLRYTERQDLVWRMISQHFTPEEQLRISTIMTIAPAELHAA